MVIRKIWKCYSARKHLHNILNITNRTLWDGYEIETWKEHSTNVMLMCVCWELCDLKPALIAFMVMCGHYDAI